MPPPPRAVFPLTVLLFRVSVPKKLSMPPPRSSAPLPLTVLSVVGSVAVPELWMPPPPETAALPLAVRVWRVAVAPDPLTLRPEVLEVVQDCAKKYGFGSPFVTETYLRDRTPVMSMQDMTCRCCRDT